MPAHWGFAVWAELRSQAEGTSPVSLCELLHEHGTLGGFRVTGELCRLAPITSTSPRHLRGFALVTKYGIELGDTFPLPSIPLCPQVWEAYEDAETIDTGVLVLGSFTARLSSTSPSPVVSSRCKQVGPEQDRKNGMNVTGDLQLKDFWGPYEGIPEATGLQTREKELKSSHLDQGYQSIFWLFWQFNYFAILDSLCLFYFYDMPMNHKPCYANSFGCKNQRFTQESSLGMRELITGVPNTPTVMMRIVLLGWGSKWDQPHKVSMLAK